MSSIQNRLFNSLSSIQKINNFKIKHNFKHVEKRQMRLNIIIFRLQAYFVKMMAWPYKLPFGCIRTWQRSFGRKIL